MSNTLRMTTEAFNAHQARVKKPQSSNPPRVAPLTAEHGIGGARPKTWTPARVAFLVENYPAKGKAFCVAALGLSDAQIRSKAARLQLKARGVSEAWQQKQIDHAAKLTGRRRPEQAAVMRRMQEEGRFAYTDERRQANSERMKKHWQTHEHPRGATGMKHTEEQRAVIGKKSRERWAKKTPEQVADAIRKQMETREKNGTYSPARKGTTWKAGWREIGGKRKYFRSRWEANYARYLEWLKSKGEIIEWLHESKVFWFDGIKRGCTSYLPDFEVTERSGRVSFHEVKGWMDDRSKTKIRRMAKYHPAVPLIVIDGKQYKALADTMSRLVDGWE